MESLEMSTHFWQNKNVFMTGHTGFKGAWLSLRLQAAGANVKGYALPPAGTPNFFESARVADGMISVFGDIREQSRLTDALTQIEPDIVIHMAAQALVREGYRNPIETYETNILGTANVLEASRRSPRVKAILVVTSDKCYDNREWEWGYREIDGLGGRDPYSSSKACAELVTAAYRQSFFQSAGSGPRPVVGVATARAGNVIGGGDWSADRLIPDMVRAFSSGHSVPIRYPGAVRPWQHVLDPLVGYEQLIERLWDRPDDYSEAWNFGPAPSGTKTVAWVAQRFADYWGPTATWHSDGEKHPHEAGLLQLDCRKAQARLGWSPRWDLEEALTRSADWYKAFFAGADMRDYSLQQIRDHSNTSPVSLA